MPSLREVPEDVIARTDAVKLETDSVTYRNGYEHEQRWTVRFLGSRLPPDRELFAGLDAYDSLGDLRVETETEANALAEEVAQLRGVPIFDCCGPEGRMSVRLPGLNILGAVANLPPSLLAPPVPETPSLLEASDGRSLSFGVDPTPSGLGWLGMAVLALIGGLSTFGMLDGHRRAPPGAVEFVWSFFGFCAAVAVGCVGIAFLVRGPSRIELTHDELRRHFTFLRARVARTPLSDIRAVRVSVILPVGMWAHLDFLGRSGLWRHRLRTDEACRAQYAIEQFLRAGQNQ
jgi:hypothetical protein